ncbi:serine/threonine-protein kinase EDR1-like isoform X1 [Canna indica]|uniref:non-specific serine/threonine protein kinase n=1 Tax=Canna indica TaxID=4628 RepID=A0AAQ3QGW9_9LILI|nr:serine/threonine-protein kinase EDR1-like isoform X1 [Canna indica]
MKNILKKLHIVPSHSEDGDASSSSPSSSPIRAAAAKPLHAQPEQKTFSGLTNWLNSVSGRNVATPPSSSSSSSSSSFAIVQRVEPRDGSSTVSSVVSEVVADVPTRDSGSNKPMEPEMDEEYQIQLALELSAREDPEAAQIEAVKQISLGSCPPENSPAEIIAYRYWNYNALGYDDKILDGFYDLYGIVMDSTTSEMPSLIDLQGTPVSDNISWEAVLVNRKEDADLYRLEQKILLMASKIRAESSCSALVEKLAILVAGYMGGKVSDPENMLKSYQSLMNYLRANVGNIVLPLGQLTVGLARHRALMFKVLADSLGIPSRLVKGKQYTGSDDGALVTVKLINGREYIVDLMSEPGTLIPSDGAGLASESEETTLTKVPDQTQRASSNSGVANTAGRSIDNESFVKKNSMPIYSEGLNSTGVKSCELSHQEKQKTSSVRQSSKNRLMRKSMNISHESTTTTSDVMTKTTEASVRSKHPRSPSLTEGISSSTVHRMKVKDVSEYMINAAKENPGLAQKLHDVLLESGVAAPPNLFTEICAIEEEAPQAEQMHSVVDRDERKMIIRNELKQKTETDGGHGPILPHLPSHIFHQKIAPSRSQMDAIKPVEGLSCSRPLDSREATNTFASGVSDEQLSESPLHRMRHMPVAAAAATAAVVASSMVVAAAKSNTDMNFEVPVAAAAAVVATTAAVSKQFEQLESSALMQGISGCDDTNLTQNNEDGFVNEQQTSCPSQDDVYIKDQASDSHQETDRSSDKSTGTESTKSENALQDVMEFEIAWEDIIIGERIGLGSFGEVYRGDWHGTEVAVKRFLHQDISSDALEEFISEVRIMKRLRHPNVVLFMGAITHVPNLSIVTEFLHRGSLFRLIHRPNNQLDERRRLRMALDIARGMNYLHNCTPIIVHRDLKSPNLLVDKNWVVKVCDFGLSRMKHNTFLSSRSTAGTAEWMAPEVLRNEPSDEKCDVFSFGVILWELCTLQQPWEGMNPMQVVGAVGFQERRLDIPDDMDPVIAGIIKKCWQTNSKMRPSFSEIMTALKPLQKPISSTQGVRQKMQVMNS